MERRLAAILAADVAGYSRLMAADEAGTHARLRALRKDFIEPKIADHHGRIVKLMGDGALVEFASVVDAVECAVAIQKGVAERQADVPAEQGIAFRIGINIGDVIFEDNDIYGDGVNVAARVEALAEPNGICVSRNVYNQVKNKVDFGFESTGEHSVKNLPEPVTVYRVILEPGAVAKVIGHKRAGTPRWRLAAVAGVVLVAAISGVTGWLQPWVPATAPASLSGMALPLPDKPSIAVLPFDNLSDESEQQYFADGITEDLITDLSKISGLFVIARNSTFAYKGKPVDIREVAEQLGVRYVLEGSIRRAGDQIRINAQLIDATTGGHLWADRYDGGLSDIFALQDAVTRQIVAALAVSLTDEEQTRQAHRYTDNADAYDAFLQGWEYYQRFSPDDFVKAIPYFERAIQLDPEYGRAYAALALLYWESVRQGEPWTSKVTPDSFNYLSFTHAWVKAQKYTELAMKHPSPLAYRAASVRSLSYRQFDDAIAEAEQAVALDPNDPDGHVALAWAMIFSGRPQDALAVVERAMRLDPQNPGVYMYVLGVARLGLGQYEDAVSVLERAHERSPEYHDVNIPLAAAYAHLGRDEEAQAALKKYTNVWRTLATNVDGVMQWWPYRREVDMRRVGGGLIKAGLCCEELLDRYIERLHLGGTLE